MQKRLVFRKKKNFWGKAKNTSRRWRSFRLARWETNFSTILYRRAKERRIFNFKNFNVGKEKMRGYVNGEYIYEDYFLVYYIDFFLYKRDSSQVEETEDVDVTDERRRMSSVSEDVLAISVRNINKSYGSLQAVKNLTFGVHTDECFGLLGMRDFFLF